MNKNFQAKVLLTLYKKLPKAIADNERGVLRQAKYGFYTWGADETLKLMQKIINDNNEKIRLINLKLLIDRAFNLMLAEDMRVISLRFFKGLKFVDLANALNVSLRQSFRMYDNAVDSFINQLEYLKYDVEKIEEEYGDIPLYKATCFKLSNDYGIID